MDNCVQTTRILLNAYKVQNTKNFLENSILSHPEHPSLMSITDTLNKYQIEQLAVKIDASKITEVPLPCIVQISEAGKNFFRVLDSLSDNKTTYYNDRGKLAQMPTKIFREKFTGVCLLAEKTKNTKEPGIEKRLSINRILTFLKVVLLSLFLVFAVINFTNSEISSNLKTSILAITYSLLKIIGLSVGLMLLWFEVDENNSTLQSFCMGGSSGNKTNCTAVLKSKNAQLFNENLSLSLLGFSYFFGSLSFIVLNDFSKASLSILGYLSFISLPFIVYSIYYQFVVIKQWCKLCNIVLVVILLETMTVLVSGFYKEALEPQAIPSLIFLTLLPILAWKLIKPLLDEKKEASFYKRRLQKIKNNPNVLHSLLSKSRKINSPTEGLGINLNNSIAKYNVIKVCSPYCDPCARAHPILEGLFKKGIINLQILFSTQVKNEMMLKPVRHFLAIDALGNSKKTQTALDDWYTDQKKDYLNFSKKYPMNGELEKQDGKINDMSAWCIAENINHTPTVFINGHELPKEYDIGDLKEVLSLT